MAKILGVGGLFFKAKDPEALADWYKKWLGVPAKHPYGAFFSPETMPKDSCTVWAPFATSADKFSPSTKEFMFNLIVDDLDGALKQVVEGGGTLTGTVEDSDYGRFGWFMDPEGNKVELWQLGNG